MKRPKVMEQRHDVWTNYPKIHPHMQQLIINAYYANYIGRTKQLLEKRSVQHISASIRKERWDNLYKSNITSGSAVAEHLIQNLEYASYFQEGIFSFLRRLHSNYLFKILETIFIKSQQHSLCKQKVLFWGLNVIC